MGLRAHAPTAETLYNQVMALHALLALLIAAPALARGPEQAAYADPALLKARAEALRDAVADMNVSNVAIKTRAEGFFDAIPKTEIVVPVYRRRMDREPVRGELGTVEKMADEADRRIEQWKRTHKEPPPPELESVVAQARTLQDQERLSYDTEGRLQSNQMGLFTYLRDRLDGGIVKLNERMKLLGALVGHAFTYATVAHEAKHAKDRESGRLSPEKQVEGEIAAFKVQHDWLALMDPSGERMLTLHGTLRLRRDQAVDPDIKAAYAEAVTYLEHLSDVRETGGDEAKLKKLVEKLGYADPGHHHDHDGHDHGRGSASPTSA